MNEKNIFIPIGLISIALLFFLLVDSSSEKQRRPSSISDIPVIGTILDNGELLSNRIYRGSKYLLTGTRDIAAFSVGNVAIRTYILTLPIKDPQIKKRIKRRLGDYSYTSKLAYFLIGLKDQYTKAAEVPVFRDYIKSQYEKSEALKLGGEHVLFSWDDIKKENPKPKEDEKEEGILNSQNVAAAVILYDAIYGEDSVIQGKILPEKYDFITNSEKDMKIVNKVQPVLISILKDVEKGMADGDMREMVRSAIADHTKDPKSLKNNKAQAVTATIIDFVRSLVLKNYRIHVNKKNRARKLATFLKESLAKDPTIVLTYLKHMNEGRKFAVQVVVDGLQGHLMEALAAPGKRTPFFAQIKKEHQNSSKYRPKGIKTTKLKHPKNYKFLNHASIEKMKEDPKYLPYFKTMYQKYPKGLAQYGISSTPTISVRNLPIVKTGANVEGNGGTGVPNFHFVDREKDRAYYFYGNDAILLEELTQEKKMLSMFKRLENFKTLNCNAQYDWDALHTYEGFINLALGEATRDFGETLCIGELVRRAKTELELKKMRSNLITEIIKYNKLKGYYFLKKRAKAKYIIRELESLAKLEDDGMPEYTLIYNPWPDHFAHYYGPFSDEILSPTGELNRLDYWLKQIDKTFKDAGIHEQTLFSMAGDHGLAPLYYYLNPENVVLEEMSKKYNARIIVKKISSDEGEGPKLTNELNPPSNKDLDVVVASTAGGNFMMDFFFNEDSNKHKWKEQPLYSDLIDFKLINIDERVDIPDHIVKLLSTTLDYLVVRETPCSMKFCQTRLIAKRGEKRLDEIIIRDQGKIFYKRLNSQRISLVDLDKLNHYESFSNEEKETQRRLFKKCVTNALEDDKQTWCDEKTWTQLANFSVKPDSIVQLSHIYDSARAGTINLFPRDGIGYNTIVPGRHAGENFHEKDAFVGFWGEPINQIQGNGVRLQSAPNGSLAPTLYEYLTNKKAVAGENSWGFSSFMKKL